MANPGNDRRIDNIEFAVSDIARSRAFYGKAIGWTFTDYGPAYCELSDGRLTGGLAKRSPVTPGGPLVILLTYVQVPGPATATFRFDVATGRVDRTQ